MHPQNSHLQGAGLARLKALYANLPVPPPSMCEGFFRASFLGPLWMRMSAAPTLRLTGLPGWQGKRFLTPDSATNVLKLGGRIEERLKMTVRAVTSMVDGSPAVALCYGEEAPAPWRWVRDELRALNDDSLLGITFVDKPVLRTCPFPFLLERER